MAKAPIAGTVYFKIDGTQYTIAGELTAQMDNFEREGVAGLSGVAGYNEKPIVPFIEVEFYQTSDIDMDSMAGVVDATVTAEFANGKTAILNNAWFAGNREVKGSDGQFTAKFEGKRGQWV